MGHRSPSPATLDVPPGTLAQAVDLIFFSLLLETYLSLPVLRFEAQMRRSGRALREGTKCLWWCEAEGGKQSCGRWRCSAPAVGRGCCGLVRLCQTLPSLGHFLFVHIFVQRVINPGTLLGFCRYVIMQMNRCVRELKPRMQTWLPVLTVGCKGWMRWERRQWVALTLIWNFFYAIILYLQLSEISWCHCTYV